MVAGGVVELGHLADHERVERLDRGSGVEVVHPVAGDPQSLADVVGGQRPDPAASHAPVERGHEHVNRGENVARCRGHADALERVEAVGLGEQRQVGDVGDDAARGEALGDERLRPGQRVTVEVHRAIEVEEHGPEVGDRGKLAELRYVDAAGAAQAVLVLLPQAVDSTVPSSGNTSPTTIMLRA